MTSNRSIRSVTLVLGSLLLFCGLPMAAEVTAPPFVVVDGDAISTEEVDTSIAPPVAKLREQISNLQRQRLETLIADRLLAKEATRRG
jgi:hypothetical protein